MSFKKKFLFIFFISVFSSACTFEPLYSEKFLAEYKIIEPSKTNKELQKYLLQYIPKDVDCKWKFKPDGDYGIDLALIDVNTGKKLLCIDLERWSAWKDEWPIYYRYLHFLGRKDHFLNEDVPFIMAYLNYNQNKVILLNKETLNKYMTREKYFSYKKCNDMVKEIPMIEGYIFGANLTNREINNFRNQITQGLFV